MGVILIYMSWREEREMPLCIVLSFTDRTPFFYFNNISFLILSRLFFRMSEKAREIAIVVVVITRGVA